MLDAKAPKAYTAKDRAALITKAGLDFNPPTDELTLSVRNPYVEGVGRLYFFNVSDYITEQDRAALFITKLGGGSFYSIALHASLLGACYLLDISVSGAPGLVLSSIVGGTSATAEGKGHALMVLDAAPHVDAAVSLCSERHTYVQFSQRGRQSHLIAGHLDSVGPILCEAKGWDEKYTGVILRRQHVFALPESKDPFVSLGWKRRLQPGEQSLNNDAASAVAEPEGRHLFKPWA